ncbi:LAQU0S07e04324g1_1 [Lachancea quebecensis]|uniref:LAQU0S07e04324g1_1 n=1 Tax=Lachancea quebecensis TaxID=1654605 RepID=A0A0N7MLQ8_9SACH|nr:LAQU0S07e04324g1_1 [Lachancea quebecensis]
MRYKGSKAAERELRSILNSSENGNKCGECGSTYPTWCSINLGVFLCGRCASVHRKILGHRDDDIYSDVRSLTMDRWSTSDLDDISESGGNRRNKAVWNPQGAPFPFDGDEDKGAVETYIREKYVLQKFRNDRDRPANYETRTSRSSSRPTTSRGGSSRDSYSERPSTSSSAPVVSNPPLPRRPATSVGPRPAVFDGSDSAASAPAAGLPAQPAVFDGFVQQYVDPATGMIYVDQQQYAMALQQQQQQEQQALQQQQQQQALLQQQQQQQALLQQQYQAQAQKNQLLSLYQRPDMYTSAVEISPSHPQYQELMQMQQLQLQQNQQLQQQQLQMQMQQQPQQTFAQGQPGFYYPM